LIVLPDATCFYIGGEWVEARGDRRLPIVDPATEQVVGEVALGNEQDVDAAVRSATRAFPSYSEWSVQDRIELLRRIDAGLRANNDKIAAAVSAEMGAPKSLALQAQAPSGTQHFAEAIRVLERFDFVGRHGSTLVRREPVGVCALISPWNWPVNQIATKLAPALAAGCTMVLKPSEVAPLSAAIVAEVMDEAGAPPGVFNLVHGDGAVVGSALTSHQDVDMISFTGSTRAGTAISENAAASIKRVALELGGKSAGILLDDIDIEKTLAKCVRAAMSNTGQSCNALTRLLVPASLYEPVAEAAAAAANDLSVGLPSDDPDLGPVANRAQFDRVSSMIRQGIDDGATLLAGGPGMPDGIDAGYFVRPTVFGDVTPSMRIARDEIFGPVLVLMRYSSLDEAVAIANDSDYGLSGYVWGKSRDAAVAVAERLRTGMVHINGAPLDAAAPFGGYKQSGNGREWGVYGLEEFLEYKSIYGGSAATASLDAA